MLLFMMYYTNGKNGLALGVRVYAIVRFSDKYLFDDQLSQPTQ